MPKTIGASTRGRDIKYKRVFNGCGNVAWHVAGGRDIKYKRGVYNKF